MLAPGVAMFCVMTCVAVAVQPFEAVTVKVYVPGVVAEIVAPVPTEVAPFAHEYVPVPTALNEMAFCEHVKMEFPVLFVMDAVGIVMLGFMVVEDVLAEEHPPELITLKI
jgi:hypothetical protein